MGVSSRDRASPERNMIWVEPKSKTAERKVAVVYYLSRDGQLEHPHFIEVTLSSSSSGLYLRDFIRKLNLLRGHGMADMYSWSSKRSYKNGFVWQDLSEDDFIYPSHGHEYILKGSQIPDKSLSFRSYETASSSTPRRSSEMEAKRAAADVATQTGEQGDGATELSGDEVSPPASRSSSGRLEGLVGSADIRDQTAGNDRASGRIKASAVLIQLISCGSRRVDDLESTGRSSFS